MIVLDKIKAFFKWYGEKMGALGPKPEAKAAEKKAAEPPKTKVFELCNGRYRNLAELARTMGVSYDLIYKVRKGERNINGRFIIGAIKAFPEYKLEDLFYVSED